MVRAAARGVVDFSEVGLFNPQDHRRVKILLREVGAEDEREVLHAQHRHTLAGMGIDNLSPDGLKSLQKAGTSAFDDLLASYFPWHYDTTSRDEREKEEVKELRAAWESHYGKLDDPETQKKLAAARKALLDAAAETRPPDTPMAQSGIYNKDTASYLDNVQKLEQNA